MYKLHILYVQLVGFNNNKFMLDVTLDLSMKVFSGDFNVQIAVWSIYEQGNQLTI